MYICVCVYISIYTLYVQMFVYMCIYIYIYIYTYILLCLLRLPWFSPFFFLFASNVLFVDRRLTKYVGTVLPSAFYLRTYRCRRVHIIIAVAIVIITCIYIYIKSCVYTCDSATSWPIEIGKSSARFLCNHGRPTEEATTKRNSRTRNARKLCRPCRCHFL